MNIDTSLLIRLTSAFGPSGHEGAVADIIENELRGYADEITRDALGNLVVHRRGTGKRVMFAAHMDSVGLIVTNIEDGFVRVSPIGGISPTAALSQHVQFENGAQGVLMCGPKAKRGELKFADMFADVGAADNEEAQNLISVGEAAVISPRSFISNGRIFSNHLDDRTGCLVLIEALKRMETTDNDVYFVFTVQEELGLRGARAIAYTIAPDIAVSVDIMTAGDTPDPAQTSLKLSKGAGIKVKDSSVITSPQIRRSLIEAAEACGAQYQMEVGGGGTDAGAIQTARGGVTVGGISIPLRYTHSGAECAALSDIEAAVKIVSKFACM